MGNPRQHSGEWHKSPSRVRARQRTIVIFFFHETSGYIYAIANQSAIDAIALALFASFSLCVSRARALAYNVL